MHLTNSFWAKSISFERRGKGDVDDQMVCERPPAAFRRLSPSRGRIKPLTLLALSLPLVRGRRERSERGSRSHIILSWNRCSERRDARLYPKSLKRLFDKGCQTPACFVNFLFHNSCGPDGIERCPGLFFLFGTAAGDVFVPRHGFDVLERKALVRGSSRGHDVICQLLSPGCHGSRQLPVRGLRACQLLSNFRVRATAERILDGLTIPVSVEHAGRGLLAVDKSEESQLISALIRKSLIARRWFKWSAARREVLRADVKRLMNVSEVMSQENYGDTLRDLAVVCLRLLILQNTNAKRNHVDNVKVGAAYVSGSVLLVTNNRDIGEVKFVMGNCAVFRICLHKSPKIHLDRGMTRHVKSVFIGVPGFDAVRQRRCLLQRHSIKQLVEFVFRRLIRGAGDSQVGYRSNQAVSTRSITKRGSRKHRDENERQCDVFLHFCASAVM